MRTRINGLSINCELAGDKGPYFVMNHGLGGSLARFRDEVPFWSSRFRVLTWDNRGCGRSDKAEDYTLKLYAQDLALLLEKLGVDSVILFGVSWGGITALRFTLDYPQMVRFLILDSTSSAVNQQAAINYRARADMVEQGSLESLLTGMGQGFRPAFAGNADMVSQQEALPDCDAGSYAGATRAIAGLYEEPMTPELGRITCPTLVVGGGKDATAGAAGSIIIHRGIPNSKLVIVQDAGHGVYRLKPDLFRQTVLEFLADNGLVQ